MAGDQLFIIIFLSMVCSYSAHKVKFELPMNYDKHSYPLKQEEESEEGEEDHHGHEIEEETHGTFILDVEMFIINIIDIKEFDFVIEIELSMFVMWTEARMEVTSKLTHKWNRLHRSEAQKLWTPRLALSDMRYYSTKNGDIEHSRLMLGQNKKLQLIQRVTVSFHCNFNFQLFPLDIQACNMDIVSATMDLIEDLQLEWKGRGARFLQQKEEELRLVDYTASLVICPRSFSSYRETGNISTLRVWIVLRRETFNYVIETYVPTGLFVIISWGSFLVKPEVVPGRMVLLVTNLLSLVTLFEAVRGSSPPVSGVKCIDVWLLSCIMFVFLALLEYAIILYRMREERSSKIQVKNLKMFVSISPTDKIRKSSEVVSETCVLRLLKTKFRRRFLEFISRCYSSRASTGAFLDRLSLIIFPTLFLTYNICYWSYVFAKRKDLAITNSCI